MTSRFRVGDRVKVKLENPGGTNRTPFFIRGKKGVIAYSHGLAGNPRDLSYGGDGEPKLPLYCVSFHMAHLYDEDPEFVRDRVLVDVWEDWLDVALQGGAEAQPIDRDEHEPTYHDRRTFALQTLLAQKGLINIDESRRLVAELDFLKRGTRHPIVSPP